MNTPTPDTTLVLSHGWGYDHRFFEPWLTATNPTGFDILALNQGYFTEHGEPHFLRWQSNTHSWQVVCPTVIQTDKPAIGLGHSLGFSALLNHAFKWQVLVSLCGFTHFTSGPEHAVGVHPLVLQRMLRKATTQLPAVLRDFHTQCGASQPFDALHSQSLLTDLQRMRSLNCAARLDHALGTGTRLVSVTCKGDSIVPPELSQACFGAVLAHRAQEGPHSDFHTHPARYTWLIDELRDPTRHTP